MNKMKLKQLTSNGSNGFVISNNDGDITLDGNYIETIINSNKGLEAYNWGNHSTVGYVTDLSNVETYGSNGITKIGNTFNLGGLLNQDTIIQTDIHNFSLSGTIGGSFIVGSGFDSQVNVIKPQSDGKILVGGFFTTFNGIDCPDKLVRLNIDGSLDTTFNSGGSGIGGISGFGNVNCIDIQTNGKILVGGNFTNYNGVDYPNLVRLNSDGSLDTTFNIWSGVDNVVHSISIQTNGKILVGGDFTNGLVRLNSDGTLDNTFNNGGSGFDSRATSISLQSDGKILVGGSFTTYNNITCPIALARLNSDGTLDNTFNNGGSGFDIGGGEIHNIVIQMDAKILVGGYFTTYNNITCPIALVRLNSDGTLDTTFNNGGAGFDDRAYYISLQSDGKILVGGQFATYNNINAKLFIRLNSDGTLDDTFNLGSGLTGDLVYSIYYQNDDTILVGGLFTKFNSSIISGNIFKINTYGTILAQDDAVIGFDAKNLLHYKDNYHVNYSNRSLIDKEYVDINIASITPQIILITRSDLQNLILKNSLDISAIYCITDSSATGTIYVRATTRNQLDPNATWIKNRNLKSFGIIAINGASGSVNTLTVNGVNIMTASVPYVTSLTQTGINVANNINANSSVSGYRAIAITNGHIVIEANEANPFYNGYVISGTATTLTFSDSKPLKNGQVPLPIKLSIIYSITTDLISYCQDDIGNIIKFEGSNNNHYNNFPWGDARYANNLICSPFVFDNFIYDSASFFISNHIIEDFGRFNTNFIGSTTNNTTGFYYNKVYSNGLITNNCYNLGNSTSSTEMGGNVMYTNCQIINNCFSGNTTTSTANLSDNFLYDGSRIQGNIASNITTLFLTIKSNVLTYHCNINSNTGNISILNNKLNNISSINYNTFTSVLSNSSGIRNNYLIGASSTINSNIITATLASRISNNILNGETSTINSNNLAGATALISGNTINGRSSGINSNTTINSSNIRNNVINATSSILTGITLSTDFLNFENLTWNADEYSFSFTSLTFNNNANRGLVNSPITLGYIMPKVIPYNAFIEYGTMTSATSTAQIKIGIETDNDSNILSSTVITSLNGTIQEYSPIFIKPSVVRKIILTPSVEDLTGGQIRICLKNKIGL